MKWLIILLLPALCWAQEFQFRQEFDIIPVEINGWRPFAPWTGGDSETAPAFCDIDADGDFDCFIGNRGYRITYYENIGSLDSVIFKYRTRYFGEISIDSMYGGRLDPCFVDIDSDLDLDLFSSDGEGLIHYWENIGTLQNAQFVNISDTLLGSSQFSNPAFLTMYDIDGDSDFDLFIGDNYWGHINFYLNIGTPQVFNFQLVTNQFENIDVGQHANPCFVDIDSDGDADLFIGERYGNIWFYRNDGTPQAYNFTYVTNNYGSINVSEDAAPAFADLDGDGDQDMAIGLYISSSSTPAYGDVAFFENTGTPNVPEWNSLSTNYLTWDMGGSVYGQGVDIDADSLHDLFIELSYCNPDYLAWYGNRGTISLPSFSMSTNNYQNIHVNMSGVPYFSDIDNDQDLDLFMGQGIIPNPPYPGLYYYQNVGSPRNAVFTLITSNLIPYNFDAAIRPALVDVDADGDKDLFIIDNNFTFYYIQNIGTNIQPLFASPTPNWQNIHPQNPQGFTFSDLDRDGDYDLFISNMFYNSLDYFENTGSSETPSFQLVTHQFFGTDIELIGGSDVDITDIDGDGDDDFIISSYRGGMYFFRNITGESPVHPDPKRPAPSYPRISILPNPGNSLLVARYSLPVAGPVSLKVYDIAGRLTGTLFYGFQLPGTYSYTWDAREKASGVYLLRLETPNQKATQKITILK
jgi:hypothetical protein